MLSAAVRVIAVQGPSAATAMIAKEAGVSNGSLFTYFETKADLFNQLYRELKSEMADAARVTHVADAGPRARMSQIWEQWLRWATLNPDKRRTLAHLDASDDITAATRAVGHQAMAQIAEALEQARESGPMRTASAALVFGLMNALTEATIDVMVRDAKNADEHCAVAFEAFWRMIA